MKLTLEDLLTKLHPFDLITKESAAQAIQEISKSLRGDIEAYKKVNREKLSKNLLSIARSAERILASLNDLDVRIALHNTANPPVSSRIELSSTEILLPPIKPQSADQVPLLEALTSLAELARNTDSSLPATTPGRSTEKDAKLRASVRAFLLYAECRLSHLAGKNDRSPTFEEFLRTLIHFAIGSAVAEDEVNNRKIASRVRNIRPIGSSHVTRNPTLREIVRLCSIRYLDMSKEWDETANGPLRDSRDSQMIREEIESYYYLSLQSPEHWPTSD